MVMQIKLGFVVVKYFKKRSLRKLMSVLLMSEGMGPLWKKHYCISPGRHMKLLCDLVGGNMLKKSTKGCI